MSMDFKKAKDAGYSDAEILEHLSKSEKYSSGISKAQKEGYSAEDILSHFSKTPTAPKKGNSDQSSFARIPMQAAIGVGTGAIYASPAGPGIAATDLLKYPAAQNIMSELLESDIEHQALYPNEFPKLTREGLEKGAQQAEEKYLGHRGIANKLSSLPFQAVGVDTDPKGEVEATINRVSEIVGMLRGQGWNPEAIKKTVSSSLFGEASRSTLLELGLPEWFANLFGIAVGTTARHTVPALKNPEILRGLPAEFQFLEEEINEPPSNESPTEPPSPSEPPITPGKNITNAKSTVADEEEILKTLNAPSKAEKTLQQPFEVESSPRSLRGRITKEGQDVGMRPSSIRNLHPEDEIGEIFSPREFENSYKGGNFISDEVKALDKQAYEQVNKAYEASRMANKNINDVHPELVSQLEDRLKILKDIPKPSTPEKTLINSIENLLERLAEIDPSGNLSGYKQIPNQTLINQIQSLRKQIDYDFAHGDKHNIFKPIIKDIQQSVERSASQVPEALETLQKARSLYADWAQTFDNDYIRPFRDTSNRDYSKLFKSTSNVDEYFQLRPILQRSPKGQVLDRGIVRNLTQEKLGRFVKNPRNLEEREFDKALREMSGVASSEEIESIREVVSKHQRRNVPERVTAQGKAKNSYQSPEDIRKAFNSRQGIKEIKKELLNKGGKDLYDRYVSEKVVDIFRKGKVSGKKLTGKDIYEVVNDYKNYEVLSELLGESTVQDMLSMSEKALGKEMTEELLLNTLKKCTTLIGGFKALKLLIKLIL